MPADRIARLCDHLASDAGLDEGLFEWQAVDAVMPKTKRNLRPLLRFLALTGTSSATNIGVGRMAGISNLTRTQLGNTAANFIRLETLKEANERLANATARLPTFRYYDIGDKAITYSMCCSTI